jgi:molybdopterin synthase sulfur carrier subunit
MQVLYFAWVKEKVGLGEEQIAPPASVGTVADLMDWLAARSAKHASAFTERKLIKAAVDQVHVPLSASVAGAREVAFFPPVTGG